MLPRVASRNRNPVPRPGVPRGGSRHVGTAAAGSPKPGPAGVILPKTHPYQVPTELCELSEGSRCQGAGSVLAMDTAAQHPDPAFPQFHPRPARGWINDPNGLSYADGRFHVFFQYNPDSARHQRICWGHLSSPDLVHWDEEPVALRPQPGGPDALGCWSGVVTDDGGVPTAAYSGVDTVGGAFPRGPGPGGRGPAHLDARRGTSRRRFRRTRRSPPSATRSSSASRAAASPSRAPAWPPATRPCCCTPWTTSGSGGTRGSGSAPRTRSLPGICRRRSGSARSWSGSRTRPAPTPGS